MSNNAIQTQPQRVPFSAIISSSAMQKSIANTLQDPKKVERFTASIITAVSVNPALQECVPHTIISAALLGESLNLTPSPQLGQFYMVPFKDKKNNVTNAQFCLGYKGLIQLALRSGYYKSLNVITIKQGELVKWDPFTEEITLKLEEDEDKRDKLPTIGYAAMFEYLNGFRKTIYWSKEKMLTHADRYSAAFSKDTTQIKVRGQMKTKVSYADYEAGNYPKDDEWMYSSFWYKDFDGMAHKTLLRQLISKWGIMSIDLQTAFEADTQADMAVIDPKTGEVLAEIDTAQYTANEPVDATAEQERQEAQQVNLNDL